MDNIFILDGKKYKQTIIPIGEDKIKDKPKSPRYLLNITFEHGHDEPSGDPGAIDHRTGKTEWHCIGLVIRKAMSDLTAMGYENVRTYDENKSLYYIGKEVAQNSNIAVSVHLNAYNKKAQYTLGLIHPRSNADDLELAKIFAGTCSEFLGFHNAGVREMSLGVLRGMIDDRPEQLIACFLAEGLFIDGPRNTKGGYEWKTLEDACKKYGEALAVSIDKFLRKKIKN